ncbi:MAG: saccharopine dehydrogenase NADP-binding domain-containing protein [Pseudomonadota bacterium]
MTDHKKRILVLGGYGTFGSNISRALAHDPAIELIIAGRREKKAKTFAAPLGARGIKFDIFDDIEAQFAAIQPDLVIHTVGPFQSQDYRVARAAMAAECHYLDLADARGFVAGIDALDSEAKKAGVSVITGASSVPCLTAAVLDDHLHHFSALESVHYGISAAQQTNRGVATTAAILTYVGKPFDALEEGKIKTVYGWQGFHAVTYPELGSRYFGDCDVPDLALFPQRYPALKTLRFAADNQQKLLHLGTWAFSWLVRAKLFPSLDGLAKPLLAIARLFDPLGNDKSGFHVFMGGKDDGGADIEHRFFIIARSAHGPYIPCVPAIILAKRFAAGDVPATGARACLDLIDLKAYLKALEDYDITALKEGPIYA